MKTRIAVLVLGLGVLGNTLFGSSGYAKEVWSGDFLTGAEVDARAVGGVLKEKKGQRSLRVLCTLIDETKATPECAKYGLVEMLAMSGDRYRIMYTTSYQGMDPQAEARESLEMGRLSKRAREGEAGVVGIVPASTLAYVLAAFAFEEGTKVGGVLIGTLGIPVGLVVDVATAPIRLPVSIIRKAKFNRRMKRFLKSIAENNKGFSTELRETDYEEVSASMNLFENL